MFVDNSLQAIYILEKIIYIYILRIVGSSFGSVMYTILKFYFLDFPKDGPKITTIPKGRNEYRVGDTANLMCKAQKSSPPTQLSWYINGEPVSIPKLFDI